MLQILPCYIDKDGEEPDLEKYFLHDGETGNFRGRKLVGVTTELKEFKGLHKKKCFSKVLMWSHDTKSESLGQILKVMKTLDALNG
jgi:hypothetical protein